MKRYRSPILTTIRAGLLEQWEAESLRRMAAEVPGTPDFRAERRALVERARMMRTQFNCFRFGRI